MCLTYHLKECYNGSIIVTAFPHCLCYESASISGYLVLNGTIMNKSWICEDLKGSGCSQTKVLSQYMPRGTDKTSHRRAVFLPRFEQSISQIHILHITATTTCSVNYHHQMEKWTQISWPSHDHMFYSGGSVRKQHFRALQVYQLATISNIWRYHWCYWWQQIRGYRLGRLLEKECLSVVSKAAWWGDKDVIIP